MLLLAATAQQAKAGFVGYYAISNFTLTNLPSSFISNGFVFSSDANTLVLWGPNSGVGEAGVTDLTIAAGATGTFQFSFTYATNNDFPGDTYADYIVGSTSTQIAVNPGDHGSFSLPVTVGETIGFAVGSLDNQGEPGELTVTNFNAPAPSSTPEPGTFVLLLFGAGAAIVVRNRRRIRFSRRVTARMVAVAVAAFCFTVPMLAQFTYTYHGSNVTGQLALTTTVNATQLALQSAVAYQPLQFGSVFAAEELLLPPARPRLHPPNFSQRLHAAMATAEPAGLTATPVITSLSVVPLSGTTGFNALSHMDMLDAYGGNQFNIEPPSPSVAVGNGYVLEGVNDAVRVYSTSGAPAFATLAANQLFGLAPAINRQQRDNACSPPYVQGVYLTDMRVYYDSGISRWFVVARDVDNDICGNVQDSSHLYLAVSQTGDPTGSYNIYVMNTTNLGHSGCPCLPDYPQIGSDQYGFHIAWNEFNIGTSNFTDAAVLSVSKTSLASGFATPTAFQVIVGPNAGYEFSIQPATTPPGATPFLGAGGLEYFVSTVLQTAGSSGVAVWAMTNTNSLTTGAPNETLTETIISTLGYNVPVAASQRPGYTTLGASLGEGIEYLSGSDQRALCLTYSTGRLFLSFQTSARDQNGLLVDAGVYIVLSPTYRNGVLAAQVLNQGYVLVNGAHLLRPAIAVNAQPIPSGAIAVTLVGPSYYPSAALIPFQTFSTPSTIEIAGAGQLPEDGFSGYTGGVARWGDYNTAVAASDGSIWMAVEYIGNFPRTTYANWNTYVFQSQP